MSAVHLANGIALRDDRVLLVASRYPNQPAALWNLPGGRLQPGELFHEAAVREIAEETGYGATLRRFAYVNESYDGDTHIISVAFEVDVRGTLRAPVRGDHVVDAAWCPIAELSARMTVAVVREPLLAFLRNREPYFARSEAGITIRWDD